MSKNNHLFFLVIGVWLSILTIRSFKSQNDPDSVDVYSSGISLGYQDAVNDFRNGTLFIADDQIKVRIERYGNEDSVYFLVFKNPNFLIKTVEPIENR